MAVNTDEASLAHRLLLTSSCAAWFLTGHRPVPVHGPGAGDPWTREYQTERCGLNVVRGGSDTDHGSNVEVPEVKTVKRY